MNKLSGFCDWLKTNRTDASLCFVNKAASTPDQLQFARDVFLYATSSKLGGLGKSGKAGDSKLIAAREVCSECIICWPLLFFLDNCETMHLNPTSVNRTRANCLHEPFQGKSYFLNRTIFECVLI